MTTHPYAIAPSNMAFHALTTSLYKDRLRAPVREILSNAIDIQNRIGSKAVIEIKLPTPLDAQFRIRDFGTGLSKTDMQRLYSSLFSSDKHLTRANEVGGFGVGAKSPFAYTDAFTVESFHNGTKTIYSAFMDGNQAPQLLELYQEDTLEPNGLAVSYPVAKTDEEVLRKIVIQEVSICGHPVECIGISEPIIQLETNTQFEKIGNAWFGHDPKMWTKSKKSFDCVYARMGNVVYPLQMNNTPDDLKSANRLLIFLTQFSSHQFEGANEYKSVNAKWDTVIFDLPIGSVKPAMSREELVLNDELTINGLRQAYAHTLEELYQKILDNGDIKECAVLHNAHEYFMLGCPSDQFRGTRFGRLLSDYDYKYTDKHETYKSGTKPAKPQHSQSNSAIDKSILNALSTSFDALAMRTKEYVEQKKIWKYSSFAIHPGMAKALSQLDKFRYKNQHTSKEAYNYRLETFIQGSMPSNESEKRGYSRSSSRTDVLFIPYNGSWSSALIDLMNSSSSRYADTIIKELSKNPYTETFLDLLVEKTYDSWSSDIELVVATSQQHESELLSIANKINTSMTIFDLGRRKTSKHKIDNNHSANSTALSSIVTNIEDATLNPTPDPQENAITAHYWDTNHNEMRETTLDAFPKYWAALDDEKLFKYDYKRGKPMDSVEHWQQHFKDTGIFYFIPISRLEQTQTFISVDWKVCIDAMMLDAHRPTTRSDWVLASTMLPETHALKKSTVTNYMIEHALLSGLKNLFHSSWSHLQRHENDKKLDVASSLIPQLKTKWLFALNTPWENALLKRYPLLNTLVSNIKANEHVSLNEYIPFDKKIASSVSQYIELVDKLNPVFPEALIQPTPYETNTPNLNI